MTEPAENHRPSLRDLPSVDEVMRDPGTAAVVARWGLRTVTDAVRELQAEMRANGAAEPWADAPAAYPSQLERSLVKRLGHGYRPVFNLTGTVVHTNLGRALLGEAAMAAAIRAATRPVTLEYDLEGGRRGDREQIVEHRLCLLTGAEAATVVNNCAAAVLLMLNALAEDQSVVVSRGELIEIGGSFRIPDIMKRAHARLVEVGTTNRTHPSDYADAIDETTRLLLKVHPSNYHISGFTRAVSLPELAAVGAEHGLPVAVDLGSGTLVDLTRFGLPYEPTPARALQDGADLVAFSGDKLLGSVQAGLVVGRADLIRRLKRNPLKRALRADKVTLAILDETLKQYEDEATLTEHIPLLATLTQPLQRLDARAAAIADVLRRRLPDFDVATVDCQSQLGSGSLPDQVLPSRGVRVTHDRARSVRDLEGRLRRLATPVIGRIADDALWLDARGAEPLDELLATLEALT